MKHGCLNCTDMIDHVSFILIYHKMVKMSMYNEIKRHFA
jgi:hypothetical protein